MEFLCVCGYKTPAHAFLLSWQPKAGAVELNCRPQKPKAAQEKNNTIGLYYMIKDYKFSEIEEIFDSKVLNAFDNSNVVGVSFYLTTNAFIPANCTTTVIVDNQKTFSFSLKENTKVDSITKVKLKGQNALECYINLLDFAFQVGYPLDDMTDFPLDLGSVGSPNEMLVYNDLTPFTSSEREHLKEINGVYIKTNLEPGFNLIAICILLIIIADHSIVHIDE